MISAKQILFHSDKIHLLNTNDEDDDDNDDSNDHHNYNDGDIPAFSWKAQIYTTGKRM